MIVSKDSFQSVVDRFTKEGQYGLDTETTGLRWWDKDSLFSIILSDDNGAFYFNFNNYPNLDPSLILPKESISKMQPIFENKHSTFFAHNAKFDMHMLKKEGIDILSNIHCTYAIARLEYNAHLKYDLDSCVKRIGLQKDTGVEDTIEKLGLWEWEQLPGKKGRTKNKFYSKVPHEIMFQYGEQDAIVVRALGLHQIKELSKIDENSEKNWPPIKNVFQNELRLTKTCYNIERIGIKIDRGYCERAILFESERYRQAAERFEEICKIPFIDSNKALKEAFQRVGISPGTTLKGNPSFTEDVLKSTNHPLAQTVLDYREAYKRANTYFQNYLYYSDGQECLHANIKQSGTETGRFSYGEPNLQNVPKKGEDNQKFPIRKAFIPRSDFIFVMLDYDQMEYRMMVDYAGEKTLLQKIKEGHDVHEACRQLMNIEDRETAKTINFQNLYGGGTKKLSEALNISFSEGAALREKYWDALPQVENFIRKVMKTAKDRGYIFNWMGRRCNFPKPEFSYAAPNHLIQGGGADVVKSAMNQIDRYLADKKSRMLVQVHDELLFEIHKSELDIVPTLRDIMENAYPGRHLKLTVGVEHSFKSWGDKVEGLPCYGTEARDQVQKENYTTSQGPP